MTAPETVTIEQCVEVALPLPIEGSFSYLLQPDQIEKAKIGVRVRVPFKNRETTGFLVGFQNPPPLQKLKRVISIPDPEPVLNDRILRLTRWLSKYYCSSWGEAIEAAVPKWVKRGKRWKPGPSAPPAKDAPPADLLKLNPEQESALAVILDSFHEEVPKPLLLYGITGSGKTEIYIRAIKEVLKQGRGAIVLVPEIALTEQILRFFFQHFGGELEILHSKLSDGERFSVWKRIESGEKNVLLGPRSAVFAPLPRLGLIIIDEEHEGSYKQDQSPRYHAREVALWRAREEKALLVLGSATPSLESMALAEKGVFKKIELTKRIEDKELPAVTIVDLKREMANQRRSVVFSRLLAGEIEANLRRQEGTLILLNRRGFSTQVVCPACGEILKCRSCEVSLTYHQEEQRMICHFCNYQTKIPSLCQRCQRPLLRFSGFGTERVESEIGLLFPQARTARVDTDSIRKKGSHEKILESFRKEEIDILVGTQMIAKGFDFPHVTLVGVVLADVGLMLPDFRSSERTFQLLTQVAGRAGRGERPGRVIIQTFSPNHPSVALARSHDYPGFYQEELKKRKEHGYPPSRCLINVLIRSKDEKKAYLFAREVRESFSREIKAGKENRDSFEVLGPAPLPYYRLRGHYRWHVLLKADQKEKANLLVRGALGGVKRRSGVAFQIDVDPLNIL